MNNNIVSFDDELLILVDENDNEIGYLPKDKCHEGDGILHRAFSIFLINDKNELLLQKRSPNKLLWGNYWSNSVCSHPRKTESLEYAALRRLKEELGIALEDNLHFLFKFQYSAKFKNIGSERELCSVFVGKYNSSLHPNLNEVAEIKYLSFNAIDNELKYNNTNYTPWFKLEWERITKEFMPDINNL